MDDDATDYETFRGCLVDLARVNRLSFGYRPTLAFLDRLDREGRWPRRRPLAILDVGSGYGDMAREIAGWARNKGLSVAVTCVDRNPWAERAARTATPAGMPIAFRTADAFDHSADEPVDVVLSALFTHHLDDATLVRFLALMEERATLGWFVNDLRRSRLAFLGFRALSGALRMHPFVRHDGPVSFARSFTSADWRRLFAEAGVPAHAVAVNRRFPFRLCVTRVRP